MDPFMMRLLIENVAIILAGTVVLGVLALGPIGRALARRIEGRSAETADLGDIRSRLEALEQRESRLRELEERLDFAERLLTRHAEPDRLGPGRQ